MKLNIYGHVSATAEIEEDEWEEMSRREKRRWLIEQLRESPSVNDVASVTKVPYDEEVYP